MAATCPHGIALHPDLSHYTDRGMPEDIRLRCYECGARALADLEQQLALADDLCDAVTQFGGLSVPLDTSSIGGSSQLEILEALQAMGSARDAYRGART